jgi:hypothetical protein
MLGNSKEPSDYSNLAGNRIINDILILIGEEEFNQVYGNSLEFSVEMTKKHSVSESDIPEVSFHDFHKMLRQVDVFKVASIKQLRFYEKSVDIYSSEKYIDRERYEGGVYDTLLYNALSLNSDFLMIHKDIVKEILKSQKDN